MRIAIRADGGNTIGMGHIMRTLVLAKELSKTNETFYICRTDNPLTDKYKGGIEKIKASGFEAKFIREDHVLEDLKDISSDLLITDSYDVNEEYFNETKNIFHKTAYIDDMNLYYFNVDYLINQNVHAVDLKYRVNENTKLLLGAQYIMLRDEFRNIPAKIITEKPHNIMITVGGADPFNITEKVINYVRDLNYKFHVVIGPSFRNIDYLKKYENDKIKLYFNANICELMQKCDIAISASGSTLYEFAASGVPALTIIIAENQKKIAKKMEGLGLTINLGWYNELNKDSLVKAVNNLCYDVNRRKEMSKKAIQTINCKGVVEIVSEIC